MSKYKLVFIGLIALSAFSFGAENNGDFPKGNPPMEMKQKITKEDFFTKLNLNTEQKTKIEAILQEFDDNMKKNVPGKESSPPKKEDMDKIFINLESKVKSVLTEAQFATFKSLLQSYLAPPGPPPGEKK